MSAVLTVRKNECSGDVKTTWVLRTKAGNGTNLYWASIISYWITGGSCLISVSPTICLPVRGDA